MTLEGSSGGSVRPIQLARPTELDDALGGRRGLRAEYSPTLLESVKRNYGIEPSEDPQDLGGSSNLNVLLNDDDQKWVVRVYRPSVSRARLHDIQTARIELACSGLTCAVPSPTRGGKTWAEHEGRLLEVEPYVEHDGAMNSWARVEQGLRLLSKMHDVLKQIVVSSDGATPKFVNYIAPGEVLAGTTRGTSRMRSWSPPATENCLADAADELARLVDTEQNRYQDTSLPRQLVHGDFWDNNVFYRGEDIVLVHDFDHMGERARIDDVALTLYFMISEPGANLDPQSRMRRLRLLVDAYDSQLERRLTSEERAALPIALARQPLWSVGGWIANLDTEASARAHASGLETAVAFALSIMKALPDWQQAFL
jgi:homoserine kinase type II